MSNIDNVQAAIDAGRLTTTPHQVEKGHVYIVPTPHQGFQTVDLDLDYPSYRAEPRAKAGHVHVDNVASFAAYYKKHSDEATEIYACLDDNRVTAVLDAHTTDGPRWGQHRLTLQLRETAAWLRWTKHNRASMSQLSFAEHVEDNLADIAPDPVPAAEMLEVAQTLQARTKVSFSSGAILQSGDMSISYVEETDASAGKKGSLTVPKRFALGLAPFDDSEPYRVEARLRYRIDGTKLDFVYVLDRPDDIRRDALKQVVTAVSDEVGADVMYGRPGNAPGDVGPF